MGADDGIPVPKECSEWLSLLGSQWWGHRYASRLRNGAEPIRCKLREMKHIVEDRLDRSASIAFRARMPAKSLSLPAKSVEKRPLRDLPSNLSVEERNGANSSSSKGKRTFDDGVPDPKRNRVVSWCSKLSRSVKVRLKSLREREDKSLIPWNVLCSTVKGRGGLAQVDSKQAWDQVMEELGVDPSKMEPDSSATFRTWYVEKRKSQKKSDLRCKAKSRKWSRTQDSRDEEQPIADASSPACQIVAATEDAEREAVSNIKERETVSNVKEVLVPLRPRRLTERLFQQHVKNLKDLFAPSLLGRSAEDPKWRACALAGKPCVNACNCKWTTFTPGVSALGSIESKPPMCTEFKAPMSLVAAASTNAHNAGSHEQLAAAVQCATQDSVHQNHSLLGARMGLENSLSTLSSADFSRSLADSSIAQTATTSSTPSQQRLQFWTQDSRGKTRTLEGQGAVRMSQIGFVCLSSVAASPKSKVNNLVAEPEIDAKDREKQVSKRPWQTPTMCQRCSKPGMSLNSANVCVECMAKDRKQESSASILAKWWRAVGSKHSASAHALDAVRQLEKKEMQTEHVETYANGASEREQDKPPLDINSIEECPKCSRSFTLWVHKQRAALVTRHLQLCCPHLFSFPRPIPRKGRGSHGASRASRVFEQEPKSDAATASNASEQRFADAFAAYRCCGRTFLRAQDLENHWTRWHMNGVVACARGYADPDKPLRKKNNQLGLRLKLVTCPKAPSEQSLLSTLDQYVQGEWCHESAVCDGVEFAGAATHTFSNKRGRGKAGNFWLAGHRSVAFAAAALAQNSDSDDSVDIVVR